MNSDQPTARIKIRCPNCRNDGSARAEFTNRRVSCKHCSHIFRALPVDEPAASPAPPTEPTAPPGRESSRRRIESLEREIRQLRDDLASRIGPPPPSGDPAEVAGLREQLARAVDAARDAEARRRDAEAATEARDRANAGEAGGLRDRLAEAEAGRIVSKASADDREHSLLREIAGLREQVDQAVLPADGGGRDPIGEEEVRALRDDLARARAAEAEAERSRREADGSRVERDDEHARVALGLRAEVERLKSEAQVEKAEAGRVRDDEARQHREALEAARAEAQAARDALEGQRADARIAGDGLATEARDLREQLDRERACSRDAQAGHASAVDALRAELDGARAALAGADEARRELDEARIGRDRASEEDGAIRGRIEDLERLAAGYLVRAQEAEGMAASWSFASTEVDLPYAFDEFDPNPTLFEAGPGAGVNPASRPDAEATTVDLGPAPADRDEAEAPRAALAEALAAVGRQRGEIEALRARLDEAVAAAAEATDRASEAAAAVPPPGTAAAFDPAAIEAGRRRAVDEAVKGAWADFERRLAETQGRLKAANARADLLEAEAREAREQVAALQRGLELDDLSSSDDLGSMASLRIMADRGTARLDQAEADARLDLARRLAVERKDRPLIDRIARVVEKVRDDLEARNYTLADTLVRGVELEAGIDPGGWSLGGLKVFRPGRSITASLAALGPAFDRAMRRGEIAAIRPTIAEIRRILGDQAGLPEIRRPGRVPVVKRPIAEPEAARLFLAAIEAEDWLMRPIAANRPLPDTALGTYAALVEGCCDARGAIERHAPGRLDVLDRVIKAAALMLARRQQPDGHFPFLDPRGRPSPAASVVEAMVAARPGAVKDGWVIAVDPTGTAQAETAACGIALARAGAALGQPDWSRAALGAADWTLGQPCLPDFTANALAASLLARAYLDGRKPAHLDGLISRVALGLLPGQVENGRWFDPAAAQTPAHLTILRALHDAWSAIPADRAAPRDELAASIARALADLLAESARLGVPCNGGALRELIRHRDLFGPVADPRLGAAILDSATVVQELCHEGPRPRLGVTPDQLAALTQA